MLFFWEIFVTKFPGFGSFDRNAITHQTALVPEFQVACEDLASTLGVDTMTKCLQ